MANPEQETFQSYSDKKTITDFALRMSLKRVDMLSEMSEDEICDTAGNIHYYGALFNLTSVRTINEVSKITSGEDKINENVLRNYQIYLATITNSLTGGDYRSLKQHMLRNEQVIKYNNEGMKLISLARALPDFGKAYEKPGFPWENPEVIKAYRIVTYLGEIS